MNKILLVYEDYPELMNVEAALKKIGFDVIGITHEYSIMEQVVSFNPEVVVGCGRGGKVSSLGVGRRLKDLSRWNGKTILIFSANNKPTGGDLLKIRSDIILEAPVPPLRLIQVLAKILGHDETVLQERLNKMIQGESGAANNPATPTFSTAKTASKNENVKFVVGGSGGSAPSEKAILGGMNFNRASENVNDSKNSEGGERGSSFFTQLRERQDLYKDETKIAAKESDKLFAEVDLKSLERELNGEPEKAKSSAPMSSPASTEKTQAHDSAAGSQNSQASTSSMASSGTAAATAETNSSLAGKSALGPEATMVTGKFATDSTAAGVPGNSPAKNSSSSGVGAASSHSSTAATAGKTAAEIAFDELVNSAAEEKAKQDDPNFWAAEKSDEAQAAVAHQQQELAKAQTSVHDRVAKYSEFLKAVPQAVKAASGQLTRTEARKRQRELVKDWDAEKLKDLDKLRREFTKALYKK